MKHSKNLLLTTFILIGTAVAAHATEPSDTLRLSEVAVTAPAKTNPELLPLNATQITASEIERSAESSLLPVLSSKIPGLFVSERGFAGYGVSGGSAGAVNIRGVGQSNKVLFMVDGMPQWAGVFGHSLADTYVTNGVERVEVVKGPSSLLYGSNAMGGSINIITRRHIKDGCTGQAGIMYGSYNTLRARVITSLRQGALSATLGEQYDRSDGSRPRSGFSLSNQLFQTRYAVSSHWAAGLIMETTHTKADYPGTTQKPLDNMTTDVTRSTAGLFVRNTYDKVDGGVQLFLNWGRNKVDDGNEPGKAPRDYLFNSTDYNLGVTAFETMRLWEANTLSAGIDFQHWGGHVWNSDKLDPSKPYTSEARHRVHELAAYAMMQQGFADERFNVNAGLRVQHGSAYGTILVPQGGIVWHPRTDAQVKALVSKGFRAPTIRELYLYAPANPDLKPESMINYELSYRQHFFGGRLMAGAALFLIDGKNMIEVVPVDGRPRNLNTGSFVNKGFELEASYTFTPRLNLSASYSYLHTDAAILQAPRHKVGAELNFTPGHWVFTLEETTIGKMYTGAPDNATTSYSLLNLRAAYTWPLVVPLTFSVRADNLTDRCYEIVYGCPMPGFTVLGGVSLKF